jgi:hypothetical protein
VRVFCFFVLLAVLHASVGEAADNPRLATKRSGKVPAIKEPLLFNTPEADAAVAAMQVFPADNAWNQPVDHWQIHTNSRNIIASIGTGKPLRGNYDMAYVLVPPGQRKVDVKITDYPQESDPGPFPIPENLPIEGWPTCARENPRMAGQTLDDIQRDKINSGGDRHAIVVDPAKGTLYEFWRMRKTAQGWQAAQASIFDLKSNRLRPDGWTSSDAAGLPIFPAIVRYDEIRKGMVEHAMRVTVQRSRRAYIAPATHFASRDNNENLPRMGERIRLKRDFDISRFSPAAQAILKGLKQYGMIVADNGLDWAISIAPDSRIPVLHEELRRVPGSAFEVVIAPHSGRGTTVRKGR